MYDCVRNGDRALYGRYIGLYLNNLKYYSEDVAFEKAYSKAMDGLKYYEKCINTIEGVVINEENI